LGINALLLNLGINLKSRVGMESACLYAEERYFELLKQDVTQIADLSSKLSKTEIVMMANFREWRHLPV
jgi:hypothetical protein